jgi:LysR family nitrogen assimilation transcriptional regulator
VAQPLILPSSEHGLRDAVEREARARGLAVTVPVEMASMNLQLDLVGRGMGCSVFPRAACRLGEAAGVLRVIPFSDAVIRRQAVLAWARDYPPSRAALALADLLRGWRDWLPGKTLRGDISALGTPTGRSHCLRQSAPIPSRSP